MPLPKGVGAHQECGWFRRVKQDRQPPFDTWTEVSWYCLAQIKILFSYTIDEYGEIYDVENIKDSYCDCLENKDRDFRITYRHVRNMFPLQSDSFYIGQYMFTSRIWNRFQEFRTNDFLTDYQIICNKRIFKVHRFVLSLISPFFRNIFQSQVGHIRDYYQADSELVDTISNLIESIYTGKNLREFDGITQLELMTLALQWEIDLDTVHKWIYTFNLGSWLSETESFIEFYEKYREILLSIPGEWSPYILACKIKYMNFPDGYTWDQNLDERYDYVRTSVQKFQEYEKHI